MSLTIYLRRKPFLTLEGVLEGLRSSAKDALLLELATIVGTSHHHLHTSDIDDALASIGEHIASIWLQVIRDARPINSRRVFMVLTVQLVGALALLMTPASDP